MNPMIDKKDLKIEYLAGANKPGGQNSNRRHTCVRITHIPTGITVRVDGREQSRNKTRALILLQYKLDKLQEEKKAKQKKEHRDQAIKDGVIRTYNFRRNKVKDHRSGKEADLKRVLNGEIELLREDRPNMRFH